jgi:choline/carnitine/betaine transport
MSSVVTSEPAPVVEDESSGSLRSRVDLGVFIPAAAITVVFLIWGIVSNESLTAVTGAILDFLIGDIGWVYVLAVCGFVSICVFLAFSRYGHVRLGKDDDRPEFRTTSWISMMFAAGMGIGLLFYGVAEPISHLAAPPPGLADAKTEAAARIAMQYTFLHWGITGWAIYAIAGLALAYFGYRHGGRNLVSTACRPILGDRVDGWLGKSLDAAAVLATLFGLIPSLGMGALQVNGALEFLWGIPSTATFQMIFIAVVTVMFVLSATTGVGKGVQFLADLSMLVAVVIALFVVVVGPTRYIFSSLIEDLGLYLYNFWPMMLRTGTFSQDSWVQSWTIFYWAWWISWAPFVGTFIARISKGRTIREFVLGVLLLPAAVSLIWFVIFGGTAIHLALTQGVGIVEAVQASQSSALFALLAQFPLAGIVSVAVMVLIVLWFVSGADAGAVVMGILCSRGSAHPPRLITAFWGITAAVAAAVLLLAGGLTALQQTMVVMSAPFMVVMLILTLGLLKQLRAEPLPAIPGHGTDVVPAPPTHRLDVTGPPVPAMLATEDGRSSR